MKPDLETLKISCPDVDLRFLEQHLVRLKDSYFSRFSKKEIAAHIKALTEITPESPARVLLKPGRDGTLNCTVLAFDYPAEFSIITGILAGMGFSIQSGDVFTYERAGAVSPKQRPGARGPTRIVPVELLKRRRIIDHFTGTLETTVSFEAWAAELSRNMREIVGLLERGDDGSTREAKNRVNEMVVQRLSAPDADFTPVLYPVRIEVDNKRGPTTSLKVVSEDTPAFLYSLSNALSLQGILIEHVKIRTIRGRIEDRIDLVDLRGGKIEDEALIDRLKILVLLTKQFTYFLEKAPDPYQALGRFEHLVNEILRQPEKGKWLESFTAPETLQALARLLGASDFLWEDFIRLQYETLLPMLDPHLRGRRFSEPAETLRERIEKALRGAASLEEQQIRLNEFKDREIFLIDLDHILHPEVDFHVLAERLTLLAEAVVDKAAELVYTHLVREFGRPRTIAGLEAEYAVLGLGKLGGAALGYASDIELLFVYSDNGRTDGDRSLSNAEFFDHLVRKTREFIQAKREGIFHVDLRLRPHGNAGPLACSLDSFCNYYGRGGQAHSYERLALVRMRAVGGSPELGSRMERLRDELVYFSDGLDFNELRRLREKQFKEKTDGGKSNAKFSPGGLVDLEYGVQILQVTHGRDFPQLRTPRTHESLTALTVAEMMAPEESGKLVRAYDFLRKLINGMRMLRGSARDLFLPAVESMEFTHLARRMGYEGGGPLDPAHQLRMDFEAHTAHVRLFVERHFGRNSLPSQDTGTVVDLILSDGLPEGSRRRILANAHFREPAKAYDNLRRLAGEGARKEAFAGVSLLVWDILGLLPDPDRALNNWERFIHSLGSPEFHYHSLLSQPMRLEILLKLFSGSQFLSDTLVRQPELIDWVMIPRILHRTRKRGDIEGDLRAALVHCAGHREWLNILRRFRRREILRIGTRDLCLGIPTPEIMLELSRMAEALTQVALERVWHALKEEEKIPQEVRNPERHFCVMALGKLGGGELNYSSDIDLLGLWDDEYVARSAKGRATDHFKNLFARAMENLRSDLSIHTEEGHAYRVDLRLRPFGRAGELVPGLSALIRYYREKAALWEIQALLKMRPVAGNLRLGYRFLDEIRPVLLERRDPGVVAASIDRMRRAGLKMSSGRLGSGIDVKTGPGGIRDVEFLVQGLQLIRAPDDPAMIEGNTLRALELLGKARILPVAAILQLKQDYDTMRRVEHCLQILDDRQIHALPGDPGELEALAKRMAGVRGEAERFFNDLENCFSRVREAYTFYLVEGQGEECETASDPERA